MFEIKITLNAPELTEAINKLADAMSCGHTACNCHSEKTTEVVEETVEEIVEETPIAPQTVEEVVEEVANPTIPVSAQQSAPVVPTVATAPVSTPEPVETKHYTLDMIARAGTVLVDAGKIAEVSALLGKYGVEVLTALDPSKYADVATDLRALGAPI